MIIKSFEQASNAVRSLTESVWIFSALNVIVETNAIAVLNEGTSFVTLEQTTKLPIVVLEQILNLLVEVGFLNCSDQHFQLSPGMSSYIEEMGLENVKAQLRTAFGPASEFIKLSREHKLIAGWHHTDELILQAQGKISEHVVNDHIPQDSELQNLLHQPGACFLDVGAGVAKITLRLCHLYNNLRVVAIEPAPIPFSLAKKNIEQSSYSNRIELRKISIENLEDKNVFDVAWYPHVFFSDDIFIAGLASVWRALRPGGKLLTVAILSDEKTQSVCIRKLINSLYGGLRTLTDITTALEKIGFENINIFSEVLGRQAITATKPA